MSSPGGALQPSREGCILQAARRQGTLACDLVPLLPSSKSLYSKVTYEEQAQIEACLM